MHTYICTYTPRQTETRSDQILITVLLVSDITAEGQELPYLPLFLGNAIKVVGLLLVSPIRWESPVKVAVTESGGPPSATCRSDCVAVY